MRRNDGFKIVIGDSWRAGLPIQSDHTVSGRGRVDYGQIRDVVDIVVEGSSICGRTDADSVFFLIRDLLNGVQKLKSGEPVARISFYEGPFELVLLKFRSAVFVTFYRSGRRPQVIVKDRKVGFEALKTGVMASALQLLTQATAADKEATRDPLISEIKTLYEGLARPIEAPFTREDTGVPDTKTIRSTRWRTPRSEESFSFGFQFTAAPTDLHAPVKPRGSDLFPLLFKGEHVVHARGRRRVLGNGFLFLQTERLLASLRQLLAAWEEGRPMSVRLISDGLIVGVRLGSDDGLVVSLMDSSKENAIVVLTDLTPWEYAEAVLGVARELRRLIVEVDPAQRRNLRLEMFSREVRALANWVKEQQRGAVINEDIERYRKLAEQRRTSDASVLIGEASRLRFREEWRVEIEAPDLTGTTLHGDVAIISARGAVHGIDTKSGAIAWRRETDRSDARFQIAGPDGLVKATPSGDIELIDLFTGVLRWRTTLSPRSGGAPVVLAMADGPAPGLVVVAEQDRKIVALDMRSGEPHWRFSTARGGQFALRRYGRLLYISSNDSHFNAVDIEDGSLVWRFTDRTRFCAPPAIHGDTLLAVGGRPGRPEGRIYALNAFSGEHLWDLPLEGGAVTAPIVADSVALVPIRIGRRCEFAGIDVDQGEVLWRRDATGWADTSALMALDKQFIVNSAGGVIRAIDAHAGGETWTTVLGPTCSEDVPLNLKIALRGGMLFVPADTVYVVSPETGHVIHSLGGEPPVPDLLQVDANCAVFVAEDSGHMAMYSLSSRLAVVPE
ncbi:MAG: PQQ-binding-like beta-propeller repeat protein [Myxococcota bacterium]|nr:PQQ-binding-like beta-propeller repeat protein [Myxococcota bacterium]